MARPRVTTDLPSIDLLRRLFTYEHHTGELMWRETGRGRRADRRIVCRSNGYLAVSVGGKSLQVHRVIWAINNGFWPSGEIDHKNGVKTFNLMENMRDCDHRENCRNSRSKRPNKLKGAFFHKPSGLYQSMIGVDGKCVALGYFRTEIDAHNAYAAAAAIHHGQYARVA